MKKEEKMPKKKASSKKQYVKTEREKWEFNLIGDFLLHLYHRKILIEKESTFKLIKQSAVITEFQNNFINAEVQQKLKEPVTTDKIQALLKRSGFLENISEEYSFYLVKHSLLMEYRAHKFKQLDNARKQLPLKRCTLINNYLCELNDKLRNYEIQYEGSKRQLCNWNFPLSNTGCYVCQMNFENMEDLQKHFTKHTVFGQIYKNLIKTQPMFSLKYDWCDRTHRFRFTITKNTLTDKVLVIDNIIVILSEELIFLNFTPHEDTYGIFYLDVRHFPITNPIILVALYKDEQNIRLIEQHLAQRRLTTEQPFKSIIILPDYYPPKNIIAALETGDFLEAVTNISNAFATYIRNSKKLDESTYASCLKILLQIEDAETLIKYKKLNQNNVELNFNGTEYVFYVNVKDTLETVISPNSFVRVLKNSGSVNRGNELVLWGPITSINCNRIAFRSESGRIEISEKSKCKTKYKIEFLPSRYEIRCQHRALDLLESRMPILKKFLFPNNVQPQSQPSAQLNLQLYNESVSHNSEQMQAVSNIVQGPRNDATYIIFGPPGTGKTTTIVEAILQILKKNCANKVLVTAQTNAACDEVALRLCKYFNPVKELHIILRLYARTQEKNIHDVHPLLLNFSNMRKAYFLPEVNEIHKYRIIVGSLGMIGKLTTGDFGKVFTHVFIDEAACCTETQALLGMVDILNEKSSLIIAGDHKQLGPVIKSRCAEDLGFNKSLMERLMEYKCYQVDTVTGNYDRSIQTRLRLNFRSHPEIVKVFNRLFYNESLEACAKAADHGLVNKWYKFPNNNYPIIFHSVKGICQRDEHTKSLFNLTEVNAVMYYLKELMHFGIDGVPIEESDIGIISPYKRQCKYIQDEINCRKWFNIIVGSVETYQGQEKKIIIASFVRCRTPTLGFLTDPRRLNVTISRPKSLLILIGDAGTLSKNPLYADIIETCRANGTLVGSDIPSKDTESTYLMESMENLDINNCEYERSTSTISSSSSTSTISSSSSTPTISFSTTTTISSSTIFSSSSTISTSASSIPSLENYELYANYVNDRSFKRIKESKDLECIIAP